MFELDCVRVEIGFSLEVVSTIRKEEEESGQEWAFI